MLYAGVEIAGNVSVSQLKTGNHHLIDTDAYVFLDIDQPLCAWATYRGVLVCAPDRPGFLSVWTAGILASGCTERLQRELALEKVRVNEFPDRVSRLRGMFCLPDAESAERALAWDHDGRSPFQRKFLAEVSLADAVGRRDQLDANWITYFGDQPDTDWMRAYWSGSRCPDYDPIWETLIDGKIIVLGTELRQKAYDEITSEFPESLMFLELGRQAARVGSDLCSITSFLEVEDGDHVIDYLMNMEDAESPEFLQRLRGLVDSGHPINPADMQPHIANESFGRVPDLRPYRIRLPQARPV